MREDNDLERIRFDVASRQKAVLFEDARRGGRSVDEFLWKGDPNAKPIQRAGLAVFGLMFLVLGTCLAAILFAHEGNISKIIGAAFWLIGFYIGTRLLLNAFSKRNANRKDEHADQ